MKRWVFIIALLGGLYSCQEETASSASPTSPTETDPGVWTGQVVTTGYVHSLSKILTKHRNNSKDSLFQDSNLRDTQYGMMTSIIKIGLTFDSLNSGDRIYWSPQNGFIIFDLAKHFGGSISNIRTANLKVKLFHRSEYTDVLKFIVSVMDTAILALPVNERIAAVQNSTGEQASYLSELTVNIKDNITPNGKVVIGIKAGNANQAFASVEYCKIEFDGDITR